VNRPNLIAKIKQMGFSEYETKCYLALFERDSLTASEVASLAGIPRPNAYESLEKLLAKGLCLSIPGKVKKFTAADPEYLREKQLDALHQMTSGINDNIDSVANELQPLFIKCRSNGSPLDYIEILKDPHHVRRKVIQLCTNTQSEMLVFTKPPYSFGSLKHRQEQKDPQIDALNRGVKVKTIYELPIDDDKKIAFISAVQELTDQGEEARVIDELPIKLAIFDEKIVLFALVDPVIGSPSVTNLVAEHPALARSFMVLFYSLWDKARNYCVINDRKIYLSGPRKKSKK
jgi:HTH-type transcriptional regulator, sugar sensing transcriptional regulator